MKKYSLSVKIILLDQRDRCLLLKRSSTSNNNPGKWDLPGGKMEKGEQFEDGLVREVKEETGLDIDLTGLAGSIMSESPVFNVVNVIMAGVAASTDVTISSEHQECGWFSCEQIKSLDMVEHLKIIAVNHMQY